MIQYDTVCTLACCTTSQHENSRGEQLPVTGSHVALTKQVEVGLPTSPVLQMALQDCPGSVGLHLKKALAGAGGLPLQLLGAAVKGAKQGRINKACMGVQIGTAYGLHFQKKEQEDSGLLQQWSPE